MSPRKWETLARRLETAGAAFLIEPAIRFDRQPGEQGPFFVRDPAGNAIDFKRFQDLSGGL